MRTVTIILIFALICMSTLARNNRDENRRRFRPSRDDLPEDPYDSNDDPNNEENSWEDSRNNDDQPWRRNHPRKQHNHRRDQTEDTNNEESNIESNVESNVAPSNTKSSTTKPTKTKTSNTQPAKTQTFSSVPTASGHLQSDTFAGTDYNDDNLFKQQCLDIHNDERASLGIDPVTYNDDLAAASKAWGEKLIDAGSLSHSPNRVHVGENVGYRSHHDDVDSVPLLIGAWIAEKKDFENGNYPDISTSGSVHDVGHYSQLIWSTTTEIGCAVVNGDGRDYMVCQYAPSGNRQGKPVY